MTTSSNVSTPLPAVSAATAAAAASAAEGVIVSAAVGPNAERQASAKSAGAVSATTPLGVTPVSIATQISRVVIATAAFAVFVTMCAMIVVAAVVARNTMQHRADTIAELVAANADVALALRDSERGREVLAALSHSDGVSRARLLEPNEHPLATYARTSSQSVDTVLVGIAAADARVGAWLPLGEVTARRVVMNGGDVLGYAEVSIREQHIAETLLRFILGGVLVFGVVVVGWTMLSGHLARRIAQPLRHFAEVTHKIRDTGDFTHRVPTGGVLEIQRLGDDFNAMLEVIERRTSEVQERNRQLAKLAFYDPLTGAANRVLLLDRMTQLIDGYRREQRPFAVIGFDLDDFKLLNDQLGHSVGDEFLRAMCSRCRAELRPADTFARLGGDEFIALLPNVDSRNDALVVARKLADAVHAANHVHSLPISCTASIGIGMFPEDGHATNELMARVDAAMYDAKAGGRNQIKFVGDVIAAL